VRHLGLALGDLPEVEPCFVVNPGLPLPDEVRSRFAEAGELMTSDSDSPPGDAPYHVPSPLEPRPLAEIWPRRFRSRPLVVTLHDLIPAIFPKQNMPDIAVRRAYWTRLELARHAARVLNVSRATAQDAVRILGLRPERMAVTGGGVSEEFRPADDAQAVREAVRERYPAIGSEFILFTGGMDYRKNVSGLVEAYAGLPQDLRDRYLLVIAGRLSLLSAAGRVPEQAAALGIADRVVATGHVSDEELVALYQAATLFVFPSRYEGFGLPVIEALACGAPAIVGRNSSLVELVSEDEALFDAAEPTSIRGALERALTDAGLLERLRRPEIRHEFTWRRIAELTVDAYREASEGAKATILR
jgi:glycosyltransferase involved in cell wall biosynthesis